VIRHRSTALAGFGTALLCNYWLLEWWLSERTDTPRSWISDLATRTEATGWRFQLLAILSGLAISAFAVLLLRRDKRALRRGLLALLAVGVFATVAGASPLSCPEGIEPGCTLAEDPGDVIHALATGGEIVATILAFLLLGLALRRGGRVTLGIGLVWVVLTSVTGLAYLSGDVDAVMGIMLGPSQYLLGTGRALLGIWFAQDHSEAPE
jgi:hypothetical protein